MSHAANSLYSSWILKCYHSEKGQPEKINKAVSLSNETQGSFRNAGESLDEFKKDKGELLNKGSSAEWSWKQPTISSC